MPLSWRCSNRFFQDIFDSGIATRNKSTVCANKTHDENHNEKIQNKWITSSLEDKSQTTIDNHKTKPQKCDNKHIFNISLRFEEKLHPLRKFYKAGIDSTKIAIIW